MNSSNKVLILNGVTAVGKSTLLSMLFNDDELAARFGFSISHTTRAPRTKEQNGINYHFVDKETFLKMKEENKFIETAENHGNYYGTSFAALEEVLKTKNIILDVDYKGAIQLKEKLGKIPVKFMLIMPPNENSFVDRLYKRSTETIEQMSTRIETAKIELKWFNENKSFYDKIIINDEIETAYAEFEDFIREFVQ